MEHFSFLYVDQIKNWSGTCGRIHSVFIGGFVCTQLSQQANWQSRDRMEICLMRPEERETEGPDYKQTKHFYIFWAEMWQTFISLRCPLARFLMLCDRSDVWCSSGGAGKEREDLSVKINMVGGGWNNFKVFHNLVLVGKVLTLYITLKKALKLLLSTTSQAPENWHDSTGLTWELTSANEHSADEMKNSSCLCWVGVRRGFSLQTK